MQLTADMLLRAYALGIFPMAENSSAKELHWIDPEMRGILPLDAVHVPRKLRRRILRQDFRVTCNQAFPEVIRACAEPAVDRPETWINDTIKQLYTELNRMGMAHSIECWQSDEAGRPYLVGGLYGVSLGTVFFGESMFSRCSDASKVALIHLVLRLRRSDFTLLDTQFTTPHLRQFGGIEIPREHYKALLSRALKDNAVLCEEIDPEELPGLLEELKRESG
ncbi:leucyl/phenylalanyl-tRNA--protein transferase [Fodinicurvata halophila]|uniref:Leucyl/phenylalanyl-tRNA--protein transferase n=1 Tax=Fodinicurvata halophila TaxID=1419723 RepID=A0ABV8UGL7_9PROT